MIRKSENAQPTRFPAVAYYRQTGSSRLQDSIAFQQHQVRAWAASHSVEIIQEFIDQGPSAQDANDRPAFHDLQENWVKQRDDFYFVLCLDLSHWGQFADLDCCAEFYAICRYYGKPVIFTNVS